MKSLLPIFICCFIFLAPSLQAQEEYNIDGKTYSLKTEVKGNLTLLWNTIDGEYRYFSKKGNDIIELKNTKANGKFQEEYKEILKEQTADTSISTEKVKLTLPSLHDYFVEYNKKRDPNFTDEKESINLKLRLGAFAGIDNSIFTANPNNALHPIAGVDLEIVDAVKLKRHAMVLRFKQTFETDDHKYSASQFSLNYRFKFIKTPKLDVYINAKFAAMTFSSVTTTLLYDGPVPHEPWTVKSSGSDFNAPFTLGIGADYKVGNGFITFNYNDIVGLNMDSNKEFPINFSLGYKFVL